MDAFMQFNSLSTEDAKGRVSGLEYYSLSLCRKTQVWVVTIHVCGPAPLQSCLTFLSISFISQDLLGW